MTASSCWAQMSFIRDTKFDDVFDRRLIANHSVLPADDTAESEPFFGAGACYALECLQQTRV